MNARQRRAQRRRDQWLWVQFERCVEVRQPLVLASFERALTPEEQALRAWAEAGIDRVQAQRMAPAFAALDRAARRLRRTARRTAALRKELGL